MEKKQTARRISGGPDIAIEDDERHSDAVAGYIARNHEALNASIKRSRGEVAKGKVSSKSIDDIVKEGRSRLSKNPETDILPRAPLVKSLDAERDLENLFDYIAVESSAQRAELILRRIARTLDNLAD